MNQQFRRIRKELDLTHAMQNKAKKTRSATLDHNQELELGLEINMNEIDLDVPSSTASGSALPLEGPASSTPQPIPPPVEPPVTSPLKITDIGVSDLPGMPPIPPTLLDTPTKKDAKDERMDEAYEQQMTGLITNIHKCNHEWNKKAREHNIVAARLGNNEHCKDSKVLKSLIDNLKIGKALDHALHQTEEKHALGQYVSTTEQTMAKYQMSKIGTCIKELIKIKFPLTKKRRVGHGLNTSTLCCILQRSPSVFLEICRVQRCRLEPRTSNTLFRCP